MEYLKKLNKMLKEKKFMIKMEKNTMEIILIYYMVVKDLNYMIKIKIN